MGVTGGGPGVGTPKHKLSSSQLHFLSDPLAPVRAFTITHLDMGGSQPKLSYSSSNGSEHSHIRLDFIGNGSRLDYGSNGGGGGCGASAAASSGSGGSRTSLMSTSGRKSNSFSNGDMSRETFNLTLDFPHHKLGNGNGTLDFPNLKIGNGNNNNTLDLPHIRLAQTNSSPGHLRRKESSNSDHHNKQNFYNSSNEQDDSTNGSPSSGGSPHSLPYMQTNDQFFLNHNLPSSHPPKGPSQRKISNRSLHGVFHSRLSGPLASLQPVVGIKPQSTRARKKRHSAIAFFSNRDKENVQFELAPSINGTTQASSVGDHLTGTTGISGGGANTNFPSVLHQLATMCRPGVNGVGANGRNLGHGLSISDSSIGPGGAMNGGHVCNNGSANGRSSLQQQDDTDLGRARKVSIALRALAGRLSLSLGKGDSNLPPAPMAATTAPLARTPRPLVGIPNQGRPLVGIPNQGRPLVGIPNQAPLSGRDQELPPPVPPPNVKYPIEIPNGLLPLTATLSNVSSASSSSNGLGGNGTLTNGVSPTDAAQKRVVRALYDYKAAQSGDLSLVQDEEYEVLEETEEHWWRLRDKHGNEGYSPSNYVKEATDVGLHQYDWYLGDATRQRAETILMREEREGCFVVRNSSSTSGMYTISVYCSLSRPQVKHYHIQKDSEGKYYLSHNIKCNSISELIYKHQYNPGGLCTRLRSAPHGNKPPATAGFSRDKWDIPLAEITLLEEIGSGQFGVVRRGRYRGLDVAVKMMKEGTMSEDEFIEEAKVMTKLQHPNLVQLYGVCKRQRPVYIITEFLEYGSLLHYLRQKEKALSSKTDTLIDMCLQISEGMAYLEKEKFIHRDLAARNCLVGSKNIKVGDFGLARYVVDDEYTGSGGAKFPIKWAAPEVLNYMRFSSKSDVWAFGVLMWEVFTCGKMPYGRRKNADVVAMVQEGAVLDKPRYCPHNVYQVMRECWEPVAEQRPSFNDLKTEIGRLNADD